MTSASAAGSDANRRSEALRFSYEQVLDATKHQDDKVGRLLGAVAFLTGGALVFANRDMLQVDVSIADRSYPMGAVTLAGFILLDLIAVATFLMAMSAPLTMPRRSTDRDSHIYFRIIAGLTDEAWDSKWSAAGLSTFDHEMLDEIKNIADRADRKYSRTVIATNLFLGALVLLAPTVVFGLASAGHDPASGPLPWGPSIRWSVAVSVFVVVGSLLASPAVNAGVRGAIGRPGPFRLMLLAYVALLASAMVAVPSGSFLAGGAWAIVLFGLAAVVLAVATYVGAAAGGRLLVGYAGAIAVVALGSLLSWFADRDDLGLFIALGGGVLVVVPNIVEELRHRSRPKSSEA